MILTEQPAARRTGKTRDGRVAGQVLAALALYLPLAAWRGFALSVLWRWFAVPVFGVRPLGVWEAAGLALIVGLVTARYDDEDAPELASTVVRALLVPTFALGFGWVILQLAGGGPG